MLWVWVAPYFVMVSVDWFFKKIFLDKLVIPTKQKTGRTIFYQQICTFSNKHTSFLVLEHFWLRVSWPLALILSIFHYFTTASINCSKWTVETLKQVVKDVRHWRCFDVFIDEFEHLSHLVLVFLLLTLSK